MASTIRALSRQATIRVNSCECRLPSLQVELSRMHSSRSRSIFYKFVRSFGRTSSLDLTEKQDVNSDDVKSRSASTKFTHFGYENVSEEDKKRKGMFFLLEIFIFTNFCNACITADRNTGIGNCFHHRSALNVQNVYESVLFSYLL